MAGVNKVILVGNLGKDPEVRYTPDGKPVTNITLATSESWKDKNTGQRQEKTEWHRVVFFGGVADVAGEYLKKGSKVYVEGKLQTRKWQDQSGNDQYTTEVVVDGFKGTMQMLDNRASDAGQQAHQQPMQNYQQQPQASGYGNQQNQMPQQQNGIPQNQQQAFPQQQQPNVPPSNPFEDEFDDDEIPF